MSGLAIFSFKCPSLLSFDSMARGAKTDPASVHNLRTLFGARRVSSDTRIRERLDEVDPRDLRGAFKAVHTSLPHGKAFEHFTALGGNYLLSVAARRGFGSSRFQHRDPAGPRDDSDAGLVARERPRAHRRGLEPGTITATCRVPRFPPEPGPGAPLPDVPQGPRIERAEEIPLGAMAKLFTTFRINSWETLRRALPQPLPDIGLEEAQALAEP